MVTEQGNRRCDAEFIARSRLRIDTRKWLASKLAPKIYGLHPTENESEKSLSVPSLDGITDPNEVARIYAQIMRGGKTT